MVGGARARAYSRARGVAVTWWRCAAGLARREAPPPRVSPRLAAAARHSWPSQRPRRRTLSLSLSPPRPYARSVRLSVVRARGERVLIAVSCARHRDSQSHCYVHREDPRLSRQRREAASVVSDRPIVVFADE